MVKPLVASLPLVVLAAACSDYDLNARKDDPEATDPGTTDTVPTDTDDTTPPGECGEGGADAVDVALNDECDVPPQTGSFTPVVEWTVRGYNAYGPPSVGNLDDDNGDGLINEDDSPEIVFVTNNGGGLVCFDGATGALKWTNRQITDGWSVTAIGDLEGDGIPEVVSSNGTTRVVALSNTGTLKWQQTVNSTVGSAQLYSALTPAIADMDGDGTSEVVVGHSILNSDGSIRGQGTYGVGSCPNGSSTTLLEGAIAVPVDIDGDGQLEVVTGNAIYDQYGTAIHTNRGLDGTAAVADLDGDGEPEYVTSSTNKVCTFETDLSPTGWCDTFTGTNYVGPIAIDDLDGDGQPDFVAVGSSEMRAYHGDGTRFWSARVTDASGAAGPILFDFELDGYPEIVYADETSVRVFNGLDGAVKLESRDHASATLFETPVVADVDRDGEVEIVMLHGSGQNGITVYGDASNSWPAGRPIWNQHAYSITNVEDDGGIPASATPNWDIYNNFRSGDAGLPPSRWNDVTPEVVDVCTEECPDRLYLTVRVWNQGTEEVPAGLGVVVRAGSGGAIVSAVTVPDAIPSGRSSTGLVIEVAASALGGSEPWVDVDRNLYGSGVLDECVEDNNAAVVGTSCD